MKTLKDIKKEFEDRTMGGYDIRILAYHPKQDRPLFVEIFIEGMWELSELLPSGRRGVAEEYDNFSLIKKKKLLPKDIFCEVWESNNINYTPKRYSDGYGGFFSQGCDEFFDGNTESWNNYKVIENPVRPWFGSECPIPDGIRFKVWFRRGGYKAIVGTNEVNWQGNGGDEDVIAYQILGEIE